MDTATVAMLAPIAIRIAQQMSADPVTFVIGVVIGSNLTFLTPIATPPLTMTLQARYRFFDYVKIGGLLNLLCVAATALLIPVIYGF